MSERMMCAHCFMWSEMSRDPNWHELRCPMQTHPQSSGHWQSAEFLLTMLAKRGVFKDGVLLPGEKV